MNLNEILKAKNLGDDVIQSIFDDMKANGIYLSSEENIDIRYGKLKTQNEGLTKERDEARSTLEELQKAAKGQENLQQIIKDHEQREEQLQAELEQTKLDAAIKVGLLAEKALDVDYLTYELKKKGELTFDENGEIKGWEDKIAALKTQKPTFFESAATRKIIENELPEGDPDASMNPKSLEEALKMQYEQKN